MRKKDDLEAKILGCNLFRDYEKEIEQKIENEISQARCEAEKRNNKDNAVIVTDLSKLSAEEKFDKNSIYRVFNRKQKTETFINGEQAENMIKYTDDYVIRFDHRVVS